MVEVIFLNPRHTVVADIAVVEKGRAKNAVLADGKFVVQSQLKARCDRFEPDDDIVQMANICPSVLVKTIDSPDPIEALIAHAQTQAPAKVPVSIIHTGELSLPKKSDSAFAKVGNGIDPKKRRIRVRNQRFPKMAARLKEKRR